MGKQCPTCKGKGKVRTPITDARGNKKHKKETCGTCHGRKEI